MNADELIFRRTGSLSGSWASGSVQNTEPLARCEAAPLQASALTRVAGYRSDGVGSPTPSIQDAPAHRVGFSQPERDIIDSMRRLFADAGITQPDSILQTLARWNVRSETLRAAIESVTDRKIYTGRYAVEMIKRAREGHDIRSGMRWNPREDRMIRDALDGRRPVQVLAWAVHGGRRWDSLVSSLYRKSNAVANRAETVMQWPQGYLRGFRDITGTRIDHLDPVTLADLAVIAQRD